MSALLLYQPLSARRREESQTLRRLCLINANAASGWARRLVGHELRVSVIRSISDEDFVGAIMLIVKTNSPPPLAKLTPTAEPA
jgi:hypothetical protein